MKHQFCRSRSPLSAIALLCLAIAARADSITFSATTPVADFSAYISMTPFDEAVTLPQFNPLLGRLENVALTLDAVGSTSGWSFTIYSPYEFTLTASGVVGGSLSLFRPDGSQLIYIAHASSFDNFWSLPPLSTTPALISVPDSTGSTLFEDGGDLSLFTGVGSITLPVRGSGSLVVYPTALGIISVIPQPGFGRVTVTYDYAAVPEPSTFALLTLTIPGMALFQRRVIGLLMLCGNWPHGRAQGNKQ